MSAPDSNVADQIESKDNPNDPFYFAIFSLLVGIAAVTVTGYVPQKIRIPLPYTAWMLLA
jgi:hypothetical protein